METTDIIKEFLEENSRGALADMYGFGMEAQVNVVAGDVKEQLTTPSGRRYQVERDLETGETWKPIRIPYGDGTYKDKPLYYDTEKFSDIGMTGWNWEKKKSIWVGYDFDSVINHKKNSLTNSELDEIKDSVAAIPWVTIRKSTSGNGLHLYVFIGDSPHVANHTEHAGLARAILGLMTGIIGINLSAKVDCYGAILWVWSKRQAQAGFDLVKQGGVLKDIPRNWRDHIDVIGGKSRTLKLPKNDGIIDVVANTKVFALTPKHLDLLKWLEGKGSWWDADRNLLVSHTSLLKAAHGELEIEGPFETVAEGRQLNDWNCFLFPLTSGWVVRRFNKNCQEKYIWSTDGSGWTKCYYDRPCDLPTACKLYQGGLNTKGDYVFPNLMMAIYALKELNIVVHQERQLIDRETTISQPSDDTIVVTVKRKRNDSWMVGWSSEKTKWTNIIKVKEYNAESIETPDETVRHLICEFKDAGWYLRVGKNWIQESKDNIVLALKAIGITNHTERGKLLGNCVMNPWTRVCVPFQPEYLGDREWNMNAPQLVDKDITPGPMHTWMKILNHIGSNLDHSVITNRWCRENNINTGGDYLFAWVAAMIQHPFDRLPMLFLYGPQNSGKSILHEALTLLFKDGLGVGAGDSALTNAGRFNQEIANKVLVVIEETDLSKNRSTAYNRLKDWITAQTLLVQAKFENPHAMPNLTHWIQCANSIKFCPIFPGDTRITFCKVDRPAREIPKRDLLAKLKSEVGQFIFAIRNYALPKPEGRLMIPVIDTYEKTEYQGVLISMAEAWWLAKTYDAPGHYITLDAAYDTFCDLITERQRRFWPKHKFFVETPDQLIRGNIKGKLCVANRSLTLSPGVTLEKLAKWNGELMPGSQVNAAKLKLIAEGKVRN